VSQAGRAVFDGFLPDIEDSEAKEQNTEKQRNAEGDEDLWS